MAARLFPANGGPSILLTKSTMIVGRAYGCDIRLQDGVVSNRHCVLQFNGTHWTVSDLGSRNGTVANGLPASNSILKTGDTLIISDAKAGTGNAVKWPVGVGADKSNGLADAVSRKAGAIGYVELSFALERNLRFASIKNLTGRFVAPDFDSVTAAANASLAAIKPDLRFSLTNAPGDGSYPVAGCTWAVLYSAQPANPGTELVKFLQWVAHDGQTHLKDLRYAPLPASLVARIDEKLASVRFV